MRPGDRVLLQRSGPAGLPAALHLTWATVLEIRGERLVVQADREAEPRTVGLDEVRSWTRAGGPQS